MAYALKIRRPRPRDVWCPACGAAPWTPCVPYVPPNSSDGKMIPGGARAHRRRSYLANRLALELGFLSRTQPRVLREYAERWG
jgi:hypothetical protein